MDSATSGQRCVDVLRHLADVVRSEEDHLTELDAALGDGDLGITLQKGFGAIEEASSDWSAETCDEVLRQAGLTMANEAPSTIGTLFATGFLGAAKAMKDVAEVTPDHLVSALARATEAVQDRGDAEPGDKTMIDALMPAVEAAREAADEGAGIPSLLDRAASAAEEGAESTKEMESTKGRARWFKERSVGLVDPGAEAVAILIRAAADHLAEGS